MLAHLSKSFCFPRVLKLAVQYSSTKYQNEEKQIKNLQLSVPKQINLEVKESAKPFVHNLAQQKVLSLAKKIVPAVVKGSFNDFIELQKTYDEDKMCSSISDLLSEFVSECCVKSIPLDNVDLRKESSKRKHSAMEDAINKMAKKDELSKVSKNQKLKKKQPSGSKDGSAKKKDKSQKVNPSMHQQQQKKTNLKRSTTAFTISTSDSCLLSIAISSTRL